ncbi:hypothetical protein B0J12DRAFT_694197 [Macrophomina phaseolina]|uniref:Uncharacterized protein n=1 Tax=Macrophomina phaseolina TaxID=35725 RepID=A0ABQ8GSV3_9PEZI|nr:hypothetical protein B0J12DRAFT_694197 [Macrophomina phaseolina]
MWAGAILWHSAGGTGEGEGTDGPFQRAKALLRRGPGAIVGAAPQGCGKGQRDPRPDRSPIRAAASHVRRGSPGRVGGGRRAAGGGRREGGQCSALCERARCHSPEINADLALPSALIVTTPAPTLARPARSCLSSAHCAYARERFCFRSCCCCPIRPASPHAALPLPPRFSGPNAPCETGSMVKAVALYPFFICSAPLSPALHHASKKKSLEMPASPTAPSNGIPIINLPPSTHSTDSATPTARQSGIAYRLPDPTAASDHDRHVAGPWIRGIGSARNRHAGTSTNFPAIHNGPLSWGHFLESHLSITAVAFSCPAHHMPLTRLKLAKRCVKLCQNLDSCSTAG